MTLPRRSTSDAVIPPQWTPNRSTTPRSVQSQRRDTAMETARTSSTRRRDRGFAALLLTSAGLMILAGRVLPATDSATALVIGVELLVWAVLARSTGLLTAGGVVTGVGSGVLLAARPLQGADPNLIGAGFVLSVAAGFGIIALLSWIPLRQVQHWAWITAAAAGTIGAGLLGGPETVAAVVGWLLPVGLIAAGVVVALRSLRARRSKA